MVKENTGNGVTATLANQSFVVGIKKITIGGQSIGTVDVTDLTRERGKSGVLIPADIAKVDEISMSGNWDSEVTPPKLGDVSGDVSQTAGDGDVLTVTWPLYPGQTAAAKFSGSGFFTKLKYPDFENDNAQEGDMVWAFNGKVGPTYTPATAT